MSRVLVTGASSGIGRFIAEDLSRRGHMVFAGTRSPERFDGERAIVPLALDVRDPAAIAGALEEIDRRAGGLDVLINNAGYGQYGALEDVTDEEARRQFDVNVFAVASLCRQVLPAMRERGSGRIVTVSSVAGKMSTPFAGWYAASKFALEALHDALRLEVRLFGLKVSLIEPAAITSGFEATAVDMLHETARTPAYAAASRAFGEAVRANYRRAAGPAGVARAVRHAVESRRPRSRYPVPRLTAGGYLMARRLLSDGAMDALLYSQLGQRKAATTPTPVSRTEERKNV
ncbi:SDR family NAD(P)-dependent oxidoreductase [Leifsonia sp. AG29]|uniref:SDR family NAD(P)-dependent oxidoreductase n=1 Tax=Leifsonia sp. AG29 TaxID=2598860 RepID=UPI00131D15B1|nr:SDR family NAD(P)-dependent oxidoreductase [Leifsonia sp. AG29]